MTRAVVGLGSCGIAAGGRAVYEALSTMFPARGLQVEITGCIGLCHREVLVSLSSPELGTCLYGDVTEENVGGLVESHFDLAVTVPEHLIWSDRGAEGSATLAHQVRLVLARTGRIDPGSVEAYIATGGYQGLERLLAQASPQQVIAEIHASGLRGRGGAGFPTATKWEIAHAQTAADKVIVCNADEGDPGAFMDRNLLEGDPFSVIEGMTVAAYAVGSRRGIVYVRDEYPLAIDRISVAIEQARTRGFLGDRIRGHDFDFDIEVVRGAGAFVCGEETALIASLEGRRGIPRRRPPYPVEQGVWGRPTVINNVETLAAVSWIAANGAVAYARIGTPQSSGTKVFSLAGDIRHVGMVEVPMGTTIREIVEEVGGGSGTGRPIKAVQIGGPSGGCLPAALFDTALDYEALASTGAMMGSGGLVAMDESRCMVEVARYFLSFAQQESCGKCTFCRVGTKRMLEMLERICRGLHVDLDLLEELSLKVKRYSECGLGQTAPNAVLTTLRYFRGEYEAHIQRRCCPARECRELIRFEIDPYACEGCTVCLDQCAAAAIRQTTAIIPLNIDAVDCARCGGCFEVCNFGAVAVR